MLVVYKLKVFDCFFHLSNMFLFVMAKGFQSMQKGAMDFFVFQNDMNGSSYVWLFHPLKCLRVVTNGPFFHHAFKFQNCF